MAETPSIVQALSAVMNEVKAVTKDGKNTFDKYNFRGIDGTMNAVGPALRNHGVIAVPMVTELEHGTVTTGKGAVMTTVNLKMTVRWYGPAGDFIESITWGEAFDRGDKATAKAHSVAFRTAMLETLCLPTQEPDPDEFSYDRGNTEELVSTLKIAVSNVATLDELRGIWNDANKAGVLAQLAGDIEKAKATLEAK